MTTVTEIAPDLIRLSIYAPAFDMQSYRGQGDRLLTDLAGVIRETFEQAGPSVAPEDQ